MVPQQAHRAFSLSDICCSAELSSKEPDFNIEPPTRRPALAATFRFCPDRHSCMACLLMSRTLGGGGHLGPHWGEEEAAVGNGTDKKQAAAWRALLTPDREKRMAPGNRFLAKLTGLQSSEISAQSTEESGHAPLLSPLLSPSLAPQAARPLETKPKGQDSLSPLLPHPDAITAATLNLHTWVTSQSPPCPESSPPSS